VTRTSAGSAADPPAARPPRLSRFIRANAETILAEWETFARSLPGGGTMDVAALRDTTAAQEHGTGCAGSGFTVVQMVAEFRALRASVTRLWLAEVTEPARTDLADVVRFNEAIDQAIAESVSRFTRRPDERRSAFSRS
jgi:hypothetical protein